MKTLLIDDNEGIRYAVSHCLNLEGIQCDTVESLTQAIEKIEQMPESENSYDSILLDLNLGEESVTTEDLIQLVHARPCRSRSRILIFSASIHAAEEAKRLGADGVISKPFSIQTLVNALTISPSTAEGLLPVHRLGTAC
jgi:CheY-like chemotaxis protein